MMASRRPGGEGLDGLRAQVRALEGRAGSDRALGRLALGVAAVDGVLNGGFAFGRVHEMAGPAADGFAVALLASLGAEGAVLWCQDGRRGDPVYPPGLAALGLDPGRVVFVACRGADECLWAMEEALASGAVLAVLGEVDRRVDLTASRRLQLAAEKGGALGVVFPPAVSAFSPALPGRGADALAPNALSTRWRVTPTGLAAGACGFSSGVSARWRLDLKRQRGGGTGSWIVEWTAHGAARGFSVVSQAGDGQNSPRVAGGGY